MSLIFILLIILLSCEKVHRPLSTAQHPGWSGNKTIYELNVRKFSQNGNFKAVEQRLPDLRDLGVGIIWLMPVQPIGQTKRKGTLGSPYSIKDYLAVNLEFGTMADFKQLVAKIHENGMYVIIDWVANHTSWDNALIGQHPDWYTRDAQGNLVPPVKDWSDVVDLNYDNKELWRYMTDALKFWVTETGIDGFRCDVAEMVPLEFWNQARLELNKIKPVFLLAEGEAPELHNRAFDMTYSWQMFYKFLDVAKGRRKATVIDSMLAREKYLYPITAMRMRFTSNHDENSWRGSDAELYGDGAKAFAVLAATLPGKPLLYNGQETRLDKRLQFFEKDPIEWRDHNSRIFYTKLFNLYQTNSAISSGRMRKLHTDKDQFIYAFVRENASQKVFVLLNLSAEKQQVTIESGHLNEKYFELFSGVPVNYKSKHTFDLEPWAYRVFVKKD